MFILTYKHACVTRFLESRKASDEELQIAKNGINGEPYLVINVHLLIMFG